MSKKKSASSKARDALYFAFPEIYRSWPLVDHVLTSLWVQGYRIKARPRPSNDNSAVLYLARCALVDPHKLADSEIRELATAVLRLEGYDA